MTPEEEMAAVDKKTEALKKLIHDGKWTKENVEAIWGNKITTRDFNNTYELLKPLNHTK